MTVTYRNGEGRTITRPAADRLLEASPRWTRLTSTQPDEGHACGDCEFVAKTAGGLTAHRNAKHPNTEEE